MKKIFTLLSLAMVILMSYQCSPNSNMTQLPEPHKNFIGKWTRTNDLIVSIKSDSIIALMYRDKSKVIEIPNKETKLIKIIKNNEFEYIIEIERYNSPFPIKHHFTFNKEENTINWGDKILLKDSN